MRIHCPSCMTPYDIDESLLPDRDIQVICRVCLNGFTLNKNIGVVKPEPSQEYPRETSQAQEPPQKPLYEPREASAQEISRKASGQSPELWDGISNDIDGRQVVLKGIRKAVALDEKKAKESQETDQETENKKADKKSAVFLMILIIILLAAAAVVVVIASSYLGIIQLPFLKGVISEIKNFISSV